MFVYSAKVTMDAFVLSFSLVIGILIITCYYFYFKSGKLNNNPPIYKGWIPWMGCAFEFGVSPLDFIEQKRKQLGSIYTLYVAGERLTFLTDADDFHHFFQSSNVDFQKAVQSPVQNVASVSEESFFQYHTKIHDMVKGRLSSSRLVHFSDKLCSEFNQQLRNVKAGTYDLHKLVRRTMYHGVINNLFGPGVLPTMEKNDFKELEEKFVIFDESFEYGARLPTVFVTNWAAAKWWLIGKFKSVSTKVLEERRSEEETLLQTLLHMVDERHAPNYALLLLWASLANAVPICFWALTFILNNKSVLDKVQAEISTTLTTRSETGNITEDEIRGMIYLRWCVLEAVRLRPTGIITRRVVKTFSIKEINIPAGDMLMLSPFWAHRNPRYFTSPEQYIPERWSNADLEKNLLLDGFVAFGGGRYQCPGRWYALMEINMYVALFLKRFNCSLLRRGVPQPSKKHLVGTQQPSESCLVQLSTR